MNAGIVPNIKVTNVSQQIVLSGPERPSLTLKKILIDRKGEKLRISARNLIMIHKEYCRHAVMQLRVKEIKICALL